MIKNIISIYVMCVQWTIIVLDGGFGSLSCYFISSSSFILLPVWSFDIITRFLYFRIWPITKCCAKFRRRTLWKRRQRWQRHSNNSVNFSAWEMWFMRFREEKRKCKCLLTYNNKKRFQMMCDLLLIYDFIVFYLENLVFYF